MNLTNLADIRALLARHDFRFSKSLGQNFLTAAWVPADIADASGADARTGVLEVGPGIGCLTEQLAQRAGKVVSVELDERLRPVLAETLAGYENVELVFGDVLALDLPQLVAERFAGLRPVVCANLPYNVTSPLLTAFLTAGCFDTVTVMIQREVARRLCARPGTADYGALTVFVQWHAEPELLFDVPPHCFVPAPKVTSACACASPRPSPCRMKSCCSPSCARRSISAARRSSTRSRPACPAVTRRAPPRPSPPAGSMRVCAARRSAWPGSPP